MSRKGISTARSFGTLLCLLLISHFVICTVWVDDLTRYLGKNSQFKEVKILTRLDENENLANPLSQELLVGLLQNIPVMAINFNKNFKVPFKLVPDTSNDATTSIDTPATLFLMVIESRRILPNGMAKMFLDTVADMATYHYSPKYLILSLAPRPSDDLEEILQFAWTRKILDLTIIEVTEPEVPRTSILIERPVAAPIISYLNPFKKIYTREEWPTDVSKLFPNKVDNMWGYPLKAASTFEHTVKRLDSRNDKLRGIFAEKLNSSDEIVELGEWGSFLQLTPDDIFAGIESRGLDLTRDIYPYYDNDWRNTQRTSPVIIDQLHFLVPIIRKTETSVSPNVCVAVSLSFGIIFAIWIAMRLLGFRTYPWRMFNIGRVVFGIGISQQPCKNVERIIFVCLLVIFVVFSSNIYEAILELIDQKIVELDLDTLEDLTQTDLRIGVTPDNENRIKNIFTGPLEVLSNRVTMYLDRFSCLLKMRHKNLICLEKKIFSNEWILQFREADGRPSMKLAAAPVWTDIYSFSLAKRSPYRSSLDKLIMRLQSAGLIEKWYYEGIREEQGRELMESKPSDTLAEQLAKIAIIGYGLSLAVFLAEIIYYRISTHLKKKLPRRPAVLPSIESN